MAEHLDHLLSGGHLLDVAVQAAQVLLLAVEVELAALTAVADVGEHHPVAHQDQDGQPPVEEKQQQHHPEQLDHALDDHGEAVVQGVGDGVHVVGEQAHQVPLPVLVKEAQGEGLEPVVQVPADVQENFLGCPDHDLGVAQGGQNTHGVDGRRDAHAGHQAGYACPGPPPG